MTNQDDRLARARAAKERAKEPLELADLTLDFVAGNWTLYVRGKPNGFFNRPDHAIREAVRLVAGSRATAEGPVAVLEVARRISDQLETLSAQLWKALDPQEAAGGS